LGLFSGAWDDVNVVVGPKTYQAFFGMGCPPFSEALLAAEVKLDDIRVKQILRLQGMGTTATSQAPVGKPGGMFLFCEKTWKALIYDCLKIGYPGS